MPQLHALLIPIRTERGGNNREHHMARSRRVKAERFAVGMFLKSHEAKQGKPGLPCAVLLTRYGPNTRPLDDDNLAGALKAVRDEVASWLGVDDGGDLITWVYSQERSTQWGVGISAQEDDDDDAQTEENAGQPRDEGLQPVQGGGVVHDGGRLAGAVQSLLSGADDEGAQRESEGTAGAGNGNAPHVH
jgi:hypothetical protein